MMYHIIIQLFLFCGVSVCVHSVDPLSLCSENLITGPFGVPDNHLTASSTLQPKSPGSYTGPERARLNTTAEQLKNGSYLYGAWSANANSKKEYIQVEFNDISLVRGIYTQGRNLLPSDTTTPEYLALYRVAVSNDGVTWTSITDSNGKQKFFRGNIDADTIEYNELPCANFAKFVRIYPEAWSQHVSLRFDVKGCQIDTHSPQASSKATTLPTSPASSAKVTQTMMTSTTTSATSSTVMMTSTTTPSAITTAGVAPLAGGPKKCVSGPVDCRNKMGNFQSCHKCTSYITCIYGLAYLRPCPAGLQWNDKAKACDWPVNANCKTQP